MINNITFNRFDICGAYWLLLQHHGSSYTLSRSHVEWIEAVIKKVKYRPSLSIRRMLGAPRKREWEYLRQFENDHANLLAIRKELLYKYGLVDIKKVFKRTTPFQERIRSMFLKQLGNPLYTDHRETRGIGSNLRLRYYTSSRATVNEIAAREKGIEITEDHQPWSTGHTVCVHILLGPPNTDTSMTKAVWDKPADYDTRMRYVDWLIEHGEDQEAEVQKKILQQILVYEQRIEIRDKTFKDHRQKVKVPETIQ